MDAVESNMIPSDPGPHNSHHAVEDTSPVGSRVFQMPPEVEQLLEQLGAIAREDTPREKLNLPEDIKGQIRLVFSEDYWRRLSAGCREDSRLKILDGLGMCWSNCTRVNLWGDCVYILGQISLREYEALHMPLQSSKVLRRLKLGSGYFRIIVPRCPELEDVAARPLGNIIRTMENLEAFLASGAGMSMTHWAQVAEALTWRGVSNLTKLDLGGNDAIGTDEGHTLILSVLRVAPKLKWLDIHEARMAEGAGKALGEAVALHQKLEHLALSPASEEWEFSGMGFMTMMSSDDEIENSGNTQVIEGSRTGAPKECPLGRFIASAFLTDHPNQSVRSLTIDGWSKKGWQVLRLGVLSEFLRTTTILSHFSLRGYGVYLLGCESQDLFEALCANCSIRVLTLKLEVDRAASPTGEGLDLGAFNQLVEFIKSARVLEELDLWFLKRKGWECVELSWPALFRALVSNSALRILHLRIEKSCSFAISDPVLGAMTAWLHTTFLEYLRLDIEATGEWRHLLRSLRTNTHIQKLLVPYKILEDDMTFRELMALSHINSTLKTVSFLEVPTRFRQRKAAVEKLFRCKSRQQSYLAELRAVLGTSSWTYPTCGRVFLCGTPMAGKTALAHCALQLDTPWYTRVMKKILPRTLGIEIHVLKNDATMQVSLWDLGGQDIFRALQQYLFPKLNKACVFAFVFSLYDRHRKQVKQNLEEEFKDEFLYWLKFITSNSEVTGFNLPTVMVVLTHKDKTEKKTGLTEQTRVSNYIQMAEQIVSKLQREFSDVLNVYPTVYCVNARHKEHVRPIVTHIYSTMQGLFTEKLFSVPEACCRMSQHILQWALENEKRPVITHDEFSALCTEAHPALKSLLQNLPAPNRSKALQAIASYLQDAGTILRLRDSNLLVANPNWLTNVFLGRLIGMGQGFEHAAEFTSGAEYPISSDGFLSQFQFNTFVVDHLLQRLHTDGYTGFDLMTVQSVLESLDLCYKVSGINGESRFFVPTLVKVESRSQLQWNCPPVEKELYAFMGLRIRCRDPRRTFLSTGFFPKFQITMWRSMRHEAGFNYNCNYNIISILHDCHHVLVENSADGSYLDVMVKSAKSKELVWKFVKQHIIEKLFEFCASAEGSPGVSLVMDILRTECVKQLTPCAQRKDQTVSREQLKDKLKQSIKCAGEDMASIPTNLYHHVWDERSGTTLESEHEAAMDLLSPEDIVEVRDWLRCEADHLIEKSIQWKKVLKEIDGTSLSLGSADLLRGLPEERILEDRMSETGFPDRRFEYGIQAVREDVQRVGEDVKRVGEDVKKVLIKVDEMKLEIMKNISTFSKVQKTTHDKVLQLIRDVDRSNGVCGSALELPRRPYFTKNDATMGHRLTSAINIGKPLLLHFYCESIDGMHEVSKQRGFELIVGRENCEILRIIARNSLKALWCLLKLGIHVTTSLGSLVPELQISESRYNSLATMSISSLLDIIEPQSNSQINVIDNSTAEKAWEYLREHLRHKFPNGISDQFSLYPVVYTTTDCKTHAWLCIDCREQGLKDGKICSK
ncbi:hypothetical protein Mapa_009770 [Marchantia paleacea]|nr:hypothetical protein Mapa_009770 [Marchantia paleacea]